MNRKARTRRLTVFIVTVVAIFALVGIFARDVANSTTLGLDLQGGFEIVYQVSPLEEGGSLPDMSSVAQSVSKRINVLGISEPQIMIEGNDRIRVQLAGVQDQESARRVISSTANLTFRDVNDNLLADASIIEEGGASLAYENGAPVVSLQIADSARFAEITEQVSQMGSGNNIMVVWLDYEEGDSYVEETAVAQAGGEPKYISAAQVTSSISGNCVISGGFTESEARELAQLINSGSLPVQMTEIYSNVVSADYGMDAFSSTSLAGAVGIAAVMLFMLIVYRFAGVIADIMLVLYIFAVFLIYNTMGGVFTLPGIAALVLGVGMTVDANVITFERIKEELYAGRSVQNAVKEGQSTSFTSILDAQLTTLLAALIMYAFGTGTVKGFATMLMVTVFCTIVINVFVSRFLVNQIVKSGFLDQRKSWFGVKLSNIPDISKKQEQFYFGPLKKIDYVGKARFQILISLAVVAAAVVLVVFNSVNGNGALNLGIDFSSGTKITVTSNDPLDMEAVRDDFEALGYEPARIQASGSNVVNVTLNQALEQQELNTIKETLTAKYGVEPNDNVVTPVVGRELVKNAVMLSLLAWVAMLIYITVRFKWDYAISCVVALVHDVAIVLAVFAIFRLEINTELISVILAIIGYSINNSIVVFDRVRETVKEWNKPKITAQDYRRIVNDSLDKTMLRSLFSSLTTIMPVIALLILGSNAIFTFNFAMFVGLIAGTLSSIFIAPTMWYWIRIHRKPKAGKKKKARKEKLDELTIPGIND